MNTVELKLGVVTGSAVKARLKIRSGKFTGNTARSTMGSVQNNMVILRASQAGQSTNFSRGNEQSCSSRTTFEPGYPGLPISCEDTEMHHKLLGCGLACDSVLPHEVTGIAAISRDDLVTCVIGCSLTFEAALIAGGVALRHVTQWGNVAMHHNTDPSTVTLGLFRSPLIVSMRRIKTTNADRVVAITAQFPDMQGIQLQSGDPTVRRIADLMRPDNGEAVAIKSDEVPVFWACGVVSQVAAQAARLPFYIAHAPSTTQTTKSTPRRLPT